MENISLNIKISPYTFFLKFYHKSYFLIFFISSKCRNESFEKSAQRISKKVDFKSLYI